LDNGGTIIAHNAQFDIGLLYKLYDFPLFKYYKQIECTLLTSQLLYPSKQLYKKYKAMGHSLDNWGKILGKTQKIEFTGDYGVDTPILREYLLADTQLGKELYIFLKGHKNYPAKHVRELEVFNTLVTSLFQIHGWKIDTDKFNKQWKSFEFKVRNIDLKLAGLFHPLFIEDTSRKVRKHVEHEIMKVNNYSIYSQIPNTSMIKTHNKQTKKYTKKFVKTLKEFPYRIMGIEFSKQYTNVKLDEFKPNSRQSVTKFMKLKYGTTFTILSETNNHKLDKETFELLIKSSTNEEEKTVLGLLRDRFNYSKIVSEYKSIDSYMLNGRIHPTVKVLGASNTTRMSASKINFQQLSNQSPVRECFICDDGYKMVDTDLSSAKHLAHKLEIA
jgi:hypothetical protein